MSITVSCFNCSSQFSAPEEARGRTFRCPACGAGIHVPPAAPPPASLGSGRVSDLLREEAQSSRQSLSDSQAARALGVTQRELFAGGAAAGAGARRPKSKWKVRGGALGFILDHKLVLAVLAISSVMLLCSLVDWHNAAISVFSFLGFGVAIGAWRSQWFANSEMKAAQDWRFLEMWIGGAMLLLLAGWGSYVILSPAYALFSAALTKGSNAAIWGVLAGFLIVWCVVLGYSIGMGALAKRHGFFKVAAWNYVIAPAALAVLAMVIAGPMKYLPPGVQNAWNIATRKEAAAPADETAAPIHRTRQPPVRRRVLPDNSSN